MKQIQITRDGCTVTFETVSVDTTENVFFVNLDPEDEHWPTISPNKLGPFPSPPSSQCIPAATYGCQIPGHQNEQGAINIFDPLSETNTTLQPATQGQPIADQQVVTGGMSPYQISGELFQVIGPGNTLIDSGSGIGPGLQLEPTSDNQGILVKGTPTLSGTYNFTFEVDDAMGSNLQQVQYTLVVT